METFEYDSLITGLAEVAIYRSRYPMFTLISCMSNISQVYEVVDLFT